MYNRLDSIPACDRQTDGQTDILPRHSPRYAYASCGKKTIHAANVDIGDGTEWNIKQVRSLSIYRCFDSIRFTMV